jgi:signal transduction histidine kinase
LIGDLTKQIELNYQHKLTDLNTRLTDTTRAFQELSQNTDQQLRQLSNALSKAKNKVHLLTILLIFVIAVLLLYLIFSKK